MYYGKNHDNNICSCARRGINVLVEFDYMLGTIYKLFNIIEALFHFQCRLIVDLLLEHKFEDVNQSLKESIEQHKWT